MSPEATWRDADLAAALVAVDPHGLGGIALRARHGPVRTAWLDALARLLPEGMALRRLPAHIGDDRLLGGLDLGATLSAGRTVASKGLLAESDGGLVVAAMAERLDPATAGRLAAALDTGLVRIERDGLSRTLPARLGVVALDERTDDEPAPPDALGERLAFSLDLDPLPQATVTAPAFTKADITAARRRLPQERLSPETEATLVAAAAACAIASLRAPILAVRAARALLALHSGALKEGDAAEIAARLVLAPRARALPAAEEDTPAEAPPDSPPEAPENAAKDSTETGPLPDRVLEAIRTALPAGLLRPSAPPRRSGDPGKAGHQRASPNRGRPIGSRPGTPDGRARLDLIATLRACAPWQPLRQRERSTTTLQVRTEDFRIRRHKRPSATATIFVVDASGSAAMARMAEAKGAIETLLAEAYVRRDEVALVAFRGTGAEVLLPPTRAPALARRRLAGLPGGGGTPLATGLETALTLAVRLRERGTAPTLVVLTDGRANIARDGAQGRPKARADAEDAAKALRRLELGGLVVDTSTRPRSEAAALAKAWGVRCLALPRADAGLLGRAARAARGG